MTESDIEIMCPGCRLHFTVPCELRGDAGHCKSCGSDVPVVPIEEIYTPTAFSEGLRAARDFVKGIGERVLAWHARN